MRTNSTPATARKRAKGHTPGAEGLSHLAVPKLKTNTTTSSINRTVNTFPQLASSTSNGGKENRPIRPTSAAPAVAVKPAAVQPEPQHQPASQQHSTAVSSSQDQAVQRRVRPASADNALLSSGEPESHLRLPHDHAAETSRVSHTTLARSQHAAKAELLPSAQRQHHDALDQVLELPLACQTAINKRRYPLIRPLLVQHWCTTFISVTVQSGAQSPIATATA